MIAKLGDEQGVFRHLVDHTVLVVDAARPVTGQAVPQWFGLADALERLALDFLDQGVDAQEHLAVGLLPVEIILPTVFGKDQPHPASSLSVPLPPSSSAIDSSNRLALLGLRNK